MNGEESQPRPLDEIVAELLQTSPADSSYWDVLAEADKHPAPLLFSVGSPLCASADPTERSVGCDLLWGVNGIRYEGAEATARMRILRPLVDDADEDVVWSAVAAIGNLEHPDVVAVVSRAATHTDSDVRWRVIMAVGDRQEDPQAVKLLVDGAVDVDPAVRNWAVFYLAGGDHDDVDVQEAPEIQRALERALSDDEPEVRMEALGGLIARGHLNHIEQLLTEYEALEENDDEDTNWEVHMRVLREAAVATGDRRFRRHLRELLDEGDYRPWQLREAICACFRPGEPEYEAVRPTAPE